MKSEPETEILALPFFMTILMILCARFARRVITRILSPEPPG